MAKLTTKQRKKLPSSDFALPKERKYPIQDKSHAANAKARAQQQYDEGKLSKDKLEKIDKKANKVLKNEKETNMKKTKPMKKNTPSKSSGKGLSKGMSLSKCANKKRK